MAEDSRRRRRLLGAVLLVSVMVIYSLTLTKQHSGDDLQKILIVENVDSQSPIPYPADLAPEVHFANQPRTRYFLQVPLASLVYRWFRYVNWADTAILPVQVIHLLAGALGVLAFYIALNHLVSSIWSFILALGLATTYVWWYFSTHVDFTIISAAIAAVLLLLVVRLMTAEGRRAAIWLSLALGAFSALGLLFFLTSGLLILIVILAIVLRFWFDQRDGTLLRLSLSSYGLSLVGVVLVVGVLVWQLVYAYPISFLPRSLVDDFSRTVYYQVQPSDLPKAALGVAKAMTKFPLQGNLEPGEYFAEALWPERISLLAWYGILALLFASPFILAFRHRSHLGSQRWLALVLVAWIAVQVPFGILWVPVEAKWWILTLIAWIALVALVLTWLATNARRERVLGLATAGFVALSIVANATSEFWPGSRSTNSNELLNYLEEQLTPQDLLITLEGSALDFLLPYNGGARTLSYPLALFSQGGNEEDVLDGLVRLIPAVLDKGGRVLLYDCSSERAHIILEQTNLQIDEVGDQQISGQWPYPGEICSVVWAQ